MVSERIVGMTRSELIETITLGQRHLTAKDVELAVKTIIDRMSETLAGGQRIEIRGFGSFSLHYRPPRIGRNPRSGKAVGVSGKYAPHFKPGKQLRDRVNQGMQADADRSTSGPRGPRSDAT